MKTTIIDSLFTLKRKIHEKITNEDKRNFTNFSHEYNPHPIKSSARLPSILLSEKTSSPRTENYKQIELCVCVRLSLTISNFDNFRGFDHRILLGYRLTTDGLIVVAANRSPHRHLNPVRPTFFRQPEHRFTALLNGGAYATAAGSAVVSFFRSRLILAESNLLSGENLVHELDLKDLSPEVATEEVEEAAVVLKHFWHKLLAEEFPATPHLTQSVIASEGVGWGRGGGGGFEDVRGR
ncbi:hypothetical protein ACJIZ3_007672 [Penstemon smallii]|uniref:Uncharacterized protein n=1 Tax=Penstemon smallii TaxID=265156 RepID=A0ABD3T8L3_9LAMI